jgi:hypothetical protein
MRCRKDYGHMVTVTVGTGEDQRQYHVFKGLLSYWSSYFRSALKLEWLGSTNTIDLPEDDPAVFDIFFHWLFKGTLYSDLTAEGYIPLSTGLICRTYVFADARGIPDLCNASVNLLFQVTAQKWLFPLADLSYIYDNTVSNSGLRKFVIDKAVYVHSWTSLIEGKLETYPKEFLADVIVRAKAIQSFGWDGTTKQKYISDSITELCKYHDHNIPSVTQAPEPVVTTPSSSA